MNWTSPQDIRERWIGDDVPENEQLLRALISDAEAIILSSFPSIQGRVNSGALDVRIINFVTARMVIRVLRNPDNATYLSQTTGPFTSAKNVGSVDLWLTDEEEAMLSPVVPGKAFSVDLAPYAGFGMGTIVMTGNGYEEGTPYLPPLNPDDFGLDD